MEETKVCPKCKEEKNKKEFYRCNSRKDGCQTKCKKCEGEFRKSKIIENKSKIVDVTHKICSNCKENKLTNEFYKNNRNKDKLSCICKECNYKAAKELRTKYIANNKSKSSNVSTGIKECRICKKEKSTNEFYKNNCGKDGLGSVCKECEKKENRKIRSKKASYSTYKDKLTIEEDVIEGENGDILCKCSYCKNHFSPTRTQIMNRISAILGMAKGENRLYCSEICKDRCSIFGRRKYPKDFKSSKTSKYRCNQSRVREVLLDLQFEEFGYQYCEKCGFEFPKEDLYFHHNVPIADNPSEYDNASHYMVVCKDCHTHNGCLQND